MNWTTVVVATASDPAPLQFLSAYASVFFVFLSFFFVSP
jgi:F0F1-type ATP synthase alpha subunit